MILFPQSPAAARTQAVAPATPPAAAPPAPGPHTQRMRRLIAVFAAIATIVMSGFTTASVRAMAQVSGRWAFWLLLPTLVLPSVVAGAAAAIGLLRFMRRTDAGGEIPPQRLRRIGAADRIWRWTLLVHLTFYTIFVVLTALLPIIPFYNQIQNPVPVPNLLVNYYYVVAAVATAVLSPRGRFLYIVLLAPFLIAGYPAQDGLRLAQQPGEQTYISQSEGRIEHDLLRREAQTVLHRISRDEKWCEEHDVQEPAAGGQDGGGDGRNDVVVVDQKIGNGNWALNLIIEWDNGQQRRQHDEDRVEGEVDQERPPPNAVRCSDPVRMLRRNPLIRIRAPYESQEPDRGGGAGGDGRQHEGRQEEPERPLPRNLRHGADDGSGEAAHDDGGDRREYGDESAHVLGVGARRGGRGRRRGDRLRASSGGRMREKDHGRFS